MELFVLGTSQRVASTRMRERMHVDLDEVFPALQSLRKEGSILVEAVPLATCGRLELYGVASDLERAVAVLRRLMVQHTGLSRDEMERHIYLHRGQDAVAHLFRVAAGLDSVIHGEAQILGQVRDAAHHPAVATTEGPVLHRLFQHALTTGKRVRAETQIGQGAVSLAGASLRILQREIGDLKTVSALILGAGDTGALMARLLVKSGVGRLVVANRTLERAEALAHDLGAEACRLAEIAHRLPEVDLVVGAVTTKDYLVTKDLLGAADAVPPWPRYFLDLAHPRNIDPALSEISGVTLFDLELVFRRMETARKARATQVPLAEAVVAEETEAFLSWLRSRENASVLKALRSQVLNRALAEAERHAKGASEEQREQMRRLALSVARALLRQPTVILREADPTSDEGRKLLAHATTLFGIEEHADEPTGGLTGRQEAGS